MHGHYLVGWLWRAVWLVAAAFGVVSASAQVNVQPVPELTGRVIDMTGTLSAVEQRKLDQKLATFEAAKGSQLVVLMIATTAPEDIASYANRVGNAWKIGRKDIGDGVLLIVAKDDRKLRIEVAKTLEGAVPDLAAKRIIDQSIAPFFKQGNFASGIDAGVDQLIALIQTEGLPTTVAEQSGSDDGVYHLILFVFLVGFVVLIIIGGSTNSKGSKRSTYTHSFDSGFDWSSVSSSSGSGSFGSGGDSFSSGGGGNFGGGGASGGW
jgi:uncharacterized protein